MAYNLKELFVTTLNRYSEELFDNITANNVFLSNLSKKGQIRKLPGGLQIEEALMIEENATVKWIHPNDLVSVGATNGLTAAVYDWREAIGTASISGYNARINADSKFRKHDLIKAEIKRLDISMRNTIARALYNTTIQAAGVEIEGLGAIIPPPPAQTAANTIVRTYGAIGGINCAVGENEKWSPWGIRSIKSAETLLSNMNLMFTQLTVGNEHPSFILAGRGAFADYQAALTHSKHYVNTTVGDGGFLHLEYMGVPFFYDSVCPNPKYMYFVNDNYLKLNVHEDAFFKTGEPRYPYNQDAVVVPMVFMGNMSCSNRAKQGVLVITD